MFISTLLNKNIKYTHYFSNISSDQGGGCHATCSRKGKLCCVYCKLLLNRSVELLLYLCINRESQNCRKVIRLDPFKYQNWLVMLGLGAEYYLKSVGE